ncbi:MAG: hypothetical protein C3F02_03280 [Parcubacteria group bacterium]|nr:MAG: hypothetical protein C3F02_03280 [Parcubacteria group bacterium]
MSDALELVALPVAVEHASIAVVGNVSCHWVLKGGPEAKRDLLVIMRKIQGILEGFETMAVRGQLEIEIPSQGSRYRGRLEYHPQDEEALKQWLDLLYTTITYHRNELRFYLAHASFVLTLTGKKGA